MKGDFDTYLHDCTFLVITKTFSKNIVDADKWLINKAHLFVLKVTFLIKYFLKWDGFWVVVSKF